MAVGETAAGETTRTVTGVQDTADSLTRQAQPLEDEIYAFLREVSAA